MSVVCALQRKREAADSDSEAMTAPSTPSAEDLKKDKKKKKKEKRVKLEEAGPDETEAEPETEVSSDFNHAMLREEFNSTVRLYLL